MSFIRAHMQLASKPEQFDVIVTQNFYGGICTNVIAGLLGSPGLSPGANIGPQVALFEQVRALLCGQPRLLLIVPCTLACSGGSLLGSQNREQPSPVCVYRCISHIVCSPCLTVGSPSRCQGHCQVRYSQPERHDPKLCAHAPAHGHGGGCLPD
jgi:isocitrate/isopropylmalate dehydrogenase